MEGQINFSKIRFTRHSFCLITKGLTRVLDDCIPCLFSVIVTVCRGPLQITYKVCVTYPDQYSAVHLYDDDFSVVHIWRWSVIPEAEAIFSTHDAAISFIHPLYKALNMEFLLLFIIFHAWQV